MDEATRPVKRCLNCGAIKPHSEFNRDQRAKDGRRSWCSPCEAARTRGYRARSRAGQYDHAERLRRSFGLTIADYDAMLAAQGGVCAICHRPETGRTNQRNGQIRRLNVDHDHDTGQVRALLCNRCNRAIGMFDDDPHLLDAAVRYLRQWRR